MLSSLIRFSTLSISLKDDSTSFCLSLYNSFLADVCSLILLFKASILFSSSVCLVERTKVVAASPANAIDNIPTGLAAALNTFASVAAEPVAVPIPLCIKLIAFVNVPTPLVAVPNTLPKLPTIFIAGPIPATNAAVFNIVCCSSSVILAKLSAKSPKKSNKSLI